MLFLITDRREIGWHGETWTFAASSFVDAAAVTSIPQGFFEKINNFHILMHLKINWPEIPIIVHFLTPEVFFWLLQIESSPNMPHLESVVIVSFSVQSISSITWIIPVSTVHQMPDPSESDTRAVFKQWDRRPEWFSSGSRFWCAFRCINRKKRSGENYTTKRLSDFSKQLALPVGPT